MTEESGPRKGHRRTFIRQESNRAKKNGIIFPNNFLCAIADQRKSWHFADRFSKIVLREGRVGTFTLWTVTESACREKFLLTYYGNFEISYSDRILWYCQCSCHKSRANAPSSIRALSLTLRRPVRALPGRFSKRHQRLADIYMRRWKIRRMLS